LGLQRGRVVLFDGSRSSSSPSNSIGAQHRSVAARRSAVQAFERPQELPPLIGLALAFGATSCFLNDSVLISELLAYGARCHWSLGVRSICAGGLAHDCVMALALAWYGVIRAYRQAVPAGLVNAPRAGCDCRGL
jgi:hypothetical protein